MTEEHGAPDLDQILDQDFSLNDDGEISISAEALRESTQEPAPDVPSQEAAKSPEAAPTHNWEERYRNLEPEFTRRSQELAELKKEVLPGLQSQIDQLTGQLQAVIAGRGPAEPEADDRLQIPENFGQILMNDPAQGAGLIAEISDRVLEQRLGPVLERVAPMLEDWELESELREAALKPGREDFFELLPTIRDIIVRSPQDIGFDAAYNLAKSFKGVDQLAAKQQAETSDQPAQSRQTTERVSPEEAQQLASRLAPDTGVSGEVQPQRRVASSVEDAFNMAVEDVLGE